MNAVNLKCKQEILMYQVKQPLSEKKQLTFWNDGHLSEYFCHLVSYNAGSVADGKGPNQQQFGVCWKR